MGRPSGREAGNALISVAMVMMLTMGLAAAVANHYLTVEGRNVGDSLAKVRAYWAMAGHVDYLYSRAIKQCSADSTDPVVADILDDLDNSGTTGVRSWSYDGNYSIPVAYVAYDWTSATYDAQFSISNSELGSVPLLEGLPNRVPGLAVTGFVSSDCVANPGTIDATLTAYDRL